MRTSTIGTARAALLTAGFVALGASMAFPASALADTNGDHSVLGGNQVIAPINAPVNVCGNAVAVFGVADAGCRGVAGAAHPGHGGGQAGHGRTSGTGSIGGGNQVTAPIKAPVNVCGNAVAVLGVGAAHCKGGARAAGGGSGAGGHRTSGRHSVLGGNQVFLPITAPVNVCGNSAAVLGEAVSGCRGGAKVVPGHPGHGGGHGQGGGRTSGKHSILGGNQVHVPVSAPVNVCGNAVGNAVAGCQGGASAAGGSGATTGRTSGRGSIGGGNQVHAPITIPVDVCGNAVAVLGDAAAGCMGGSSGHGGHGGGGGYGGGGNGGGGGYGSRTAQGAAGQAAPALPAVPGVSNVRPMDPGSALPALPKLPVRPPQAASNRTAGATNLPAPVDGLAGHAAHALGNGMKDGVQNVPHAAAPAAQPRSAARAAETDAAGARPAKPIVPPVALPGLSELPVVGDVTVPAASQPMRPAAASQPLSSGIGDDSLYVFTLGALLAGASAVIGVTRRLRRR
jgi:hypothetical protein